MTEPVVKLYFDYKSPFAYLAMAPAFDLERSFAVRVRWIPYVLRIKGKGERSLYSDWKAAYSYRDARRWANRRGGFLIRGPRRVYDSSPALIGGLHAEREGVFRPYTEAVFRRFFERELEIDQPQAIAAVLNGLGADGAGYLRWQDGEGRRALDACVEEGHRDHVFGVPLFLFRDEPFWGYDRLPLLQETLAAAGLERCAGA
jgi:2-hydroxychromene-2-carboxylate isomerase